MPCLEVMRHIERTARRDRKIASVAWLRRLNRDCARRSSRPDLQRARQCCWGFPQLTETLHAKCLAGS